MRIEFRGISTASLGAMLGGYGVMAGVGATWAGRPFLVDTGGCARN